LLKVDAVDPALSALLKVGSSSRLYPMSIQLSSALLMVDAAEEGRAYSIKSSNGLVKTNYLIVRVRS
jgi:hypothetical protein